MTDNEVIDKFMSAVYKGLNNIIGFDIQTIGDTDNLQLIRIARSPTFHDYFTEFDAGSVGVKMFNLNERGIRLMEQHGGYLKYLEKERKKENFKKWKKRISLFTKASTIISLLLSAAISIFLAIRAVSEQQEQKSQRQEQKRLSMERDSLLRILSKPQIIRDTVWIPLPKSK